MTICDINQAWYWPKCTANAQTARDAKYYQLGNISQNVTQLASLGRSER